MIIKKRSSICVTYVISKRVPTDPPRYTLYQCSVKTLQTSDKQKNLSHNFKCIQIMN